VDVRHLLRIPCTITPRADGTDDDVYGNPVTEAGDPITTTCWVTRRGSQSDSQERTGGDTWQLEAVDIYLPPGTPVTGYDAITVDDVAYEVVGPPFEHRHPITRAVKYVHLVARRAV
jgi:hypothetical protein